MVFLSQKVREEVTPDTAATLAPTPWDTQAHVTGPMQSPSTWPKMLRNTQGTEKSQRQDWHRGEPAP